jgi:hypothetical protein
MNTKTKGKLRLKKGIFMIRVGKFYDSHLATLYDTTFKKLNFPRYVQHEALTTNFTSYLSKRRHNLK